MKRAAFIIFSFFIMFSIVRAEDDPITRLKNETMLYFKPMTGTITSVDGHKVIMKIETKDLVKPGMRLKVLREGSPFIHPVTKELLGMVESTTGKVEIKESGTESSAGIIVEGEAREGDKIRISETKIKMFFCQDKNIDWYLADEYYRKLKATGRIEMIDSALETNEKTEVIKEAKRLGAEVALLLTTKEDDKGILLREQLFWVSDGSRFIDMETMVDIAFAKELKFGEEFFNPRNSDVIFMYDIPFEARFVLTGDFDGDGKQEVVLSTGKDVRVYLPAADLQYLWEVKGSARDYHLWIDSIDLNKNGKDELVITFMRSGKVVSYIYELTGSEFNKLWEGRYFLRRIGASLLAQSYSDAKGFAGDIFTMTWNDRYRIDEKVKVPMGVNIYDFIYIEGAGDERLTFAYDEDGFLNLYDEKGGRLWRSSSNTGGFTTTFELESAATDIDWGGWSVKDRLIPRYKEVLVIERIPFIEMAKRMGSNFITFMGHKRSRIRNYWWNGFSMEEGVLIDDIKGSVMDYAISGDKMFVLTSPFLGIKFGNILKGKNPLGSVLYIYSIKDIF